MTEPSQEPSLPDDRTRDITLPPLPDRPGPALPKAWQSLPSVDQPTTAVAGPAAAPPARATPPVAAEPAPTVAEPAASTVAESATPQVSKEEAVARIEARRLASQRTDELVQPPAAQRRDRTLSFSEPEMRNRPVEPVQVGRTSRRWPWVVLTLLPILVIVGAALAWMLLLDGV
ncbi:hypothetical protein DQ244_05825 [Blastococcus sp. TBT05-19]|uniref:hypothetical protein n=1 Tax=Blastococcus sp. TBT05-19 TaxID=2250581 RepID=UPI000DE88B90|nr:hypothetical protein [Blastococcus sp. TBT05-19]RBY94785.1 hypothetical protein DQ244_05825 [Blastococcus sp. TBT05-19]